MQPAYGLDMMETTHMHMHPVLKKNVKNLINVQEARGQEWVLHVGQAEKWK